MAVSPTNGNDVWLGAADGGLWHSTDGGQHWTSVSDNSTVNGGPWPTLSIGAIAIDPHNANTIYVGTGEANFNGDAYWGAGVFKSTDDGATWAQYGLTEFGGLGIAKVAVDPFNSSNVMVAVGFDGLTAPSGSIVPIGNVGVWKSADGGVHWAKAQLGGGSFSGFNAGTDVAYDPNHPNVIYAGLGNTLGVPQSQFVSAAGIWWTGNGGDYWMRYEFAPTMNDVQRVSLAVSSDSSRLYAVITDADARDYPSSPNFGTLYNHSIYTYGSTGGGTVEWVALDASSAPGMANDNAERQWWYNSAVAIEPADPNTVYVGGTDLWRTTATMSDRTPTWSNLTQVYGSTPTGPHPDQHAIAFAPSSTNLYLGNDGGVWSADSSAHFTNLNGGGLNITQLYSGGVSQYAGQTCGAARNGQCPAIYGGAQDNGAAAYPSQLGLSVPTSGPPAWLQILGGDAVAATPDPNGSNVVYQESPYGDLHKTLDGGTTWSTATSGINICTPEFPTICTNGGDPVNFVAPIALSGNTAVILLGTDKVYASRDAAQTWSAVSPSLDTYSCGVSTCSVPLSALAVSPLYLSYMYAGDNHGNVYTTTTGLNSTPSWSGGALCLNGMVTSLAVDPNTATVAYATCAGFASGAGLHIFKTTNAGAAGAMSAPLCRTYPSSRWPSAQ